MLTTFSPGLANRDNKRMKELVAAFKSNAFPTTIIYNKEGKEAYRVSGFGQKPETYKKLLAKKIDSLLCFNRRKPFQR